MLVKCAKELKTSVEDLPKATWQKIAPRLDSKFMQDLSFEAAVERRDLQGGTSLATAKAGIKQLKQNLNQELAWQKKGTRA